MSSNQRNEYSGLRQVVPTVIQRSKDCPYLWVRLRPDRAGYIPGMVYSSACTVSWPYHGWFQNARSRLRHESGARRLSSDQGEEDQEEAS